MNGRKAVSALVILGSPIYLLPAGPFMLLVVPVVTALLGQQLWPSLSRKKLVALGAATVAAMFVVYLLAVVWFYGLGGPTGVWLWAGPLAALIVYVTGMPLVVRRPWAWPLVITTALLTTAAIGLLAAITGVRFES